MKIFNLTNKDLLNSFAAESKNSQFQQSWEWGGLQESAGHKVLRLGVEDDGGLIAAATLIKKNLGMGKSYFYCPRGPLMQVESKKLKVKSYEFLFDHINNLMKQENIIFLRFEPSLKIENCKLKIERTMDVQPSKTSILDISKSEEDLLKAMHQKTRYNIKLAEKKGVKIREGSMEDFEGFWKLMSETKDRDGFRVHSKDYYRKMLGIGKDNAEVNDLNFQFPISNFQFPNKFKIQNSKLYIKLFLAEYEGRIIAGNIIGFFGDTATYMHGASSNEDRNVMAPFAMQWRCICLSKSLGYKYYDFYGIDEKKWPGVTRFKQGFSGAEIKYPGTFDLVFDKKWYNAYKLFRKLRRLV